MTVRGLTPKPMLNKPMAAQLLDHPIILCKCATSSGPCWASSFLPKARISLEKPSKSNFKSHWSSFFSSSDLVELALELALELDLVWSGRHMVMSVGGSVGSISECYKVLQGDTSTVTRCFERSTYVYVCVFVEYNLKYCAFPSISTWWWLAGRSIDDILQNSSIYFIISFICLLLIFCSDDYNRQEDAPSSWATLLVRILCRCLRNRSAFVGPRHTPRR